MPQRAKRTLVPHQAFNPDCRCINCRSSASSRVLSVAPDGPALQPTTDHLEVSSWHRAGWSARPLRYDVRQIGKPQQMSRQNSTVDEALPGPTVDKAPRVYNAPVWLKPTECTFIHTRAMQHTHRTTLLRSSVPSRLTNYGSLLSEMDERLHNMHRTLAAVHRRSATVVSQQLAQAEQPAAAVGAAGGYDQRQWPQEEVLGDAERDQHWKGLGEQAGAIGAGLDEASQGQQWRQAGASGSNQAEDGISAGPTPEPVLDHIRLRRAVNSSLDQQMKFFTGCMAKWCLDKCDCKCLGCNCICQQSQTTLAKTVYGQ